MAIFAIQGEQCDQDGRLFLYYQVGNEYHQLGKSYTITKIEYSYNGEWYRVKSDEMVLCSVKVSYVAVVHYEL